ncbi:putative F-box protein At3g29830 [Glycine soja]|uniref:putative F-box protein At3g29830 n=1 Tax=Glycine soja TaxID=3848 RepID=UPI001038F465|nr:putative F-box protein At3g29830 [Glycine soja]
MYGKERKYIRYTHFSLESLTLHSCSFIETKVFNFGALKEVSLGWMEVRLSAIKALLSNCNMLESLSFKRCWNSDKFDLGEEKHMGLTQLVLDQCGFDFDYFKVNAPNLKIFKYCGWMNFDLIEIDSLAMEEIDLDFSLVISTGSEQLHMEPDMDVRHSIMKMALQHNEFSRISLFLNSCPMLERLTIELVKLDKNG